MPSPEGDYRRWLPVLVGIRGTAGWVRYETNVFGLIDMTKAVLPVRRAQRSGLIVNVSSIGGITSFAATGYYYGTK